MGASKRCIRVHKSTGERVETTEKEVKNLREVLNDYARRNKTLYFDDIYSIEFEKVEPVVEPKADEKQPNEEQTGED